MMHRILLENTRMFSKVRTSILTFCQRVCFEFFFQTSLYQPLIVIPFSLVPRVFFALHTHIITDCNIIVKLVRDARITPFRDLCAGHAGIGLYL